ncbi:MAG: hypothetical protein KF819_11730 [Labilithrix sp.]|nr:hypothetical protein [Labilithrix sp.]
MTFLAGCVLVPACSTTNADDVPSCTNGVRDGDEIGTDCGGACTTRCTGAGCTANEECSSGKCESGTCAAPAGKPCGVGVSVECNDGEPCELDKDCVSGFCDAAKCARPPEGSHSDGKKNAGETGVDCGGSVKATQPCPDGEGCVDSSDCVGTCLDGVCGPPGPTDGKKNNGETDVDCGGPNAPKCPNGKACEANDDCVDLYCAASTKICTAPRNDDGVQNGSETDVDCGGTSGKKCAEGLNCLVDGDCNGACNYAKKCVDMPSCKPRFGGDTCGGGDLGNGFAETHETGAGTVAGHESCCRTLLVPGYADPARPGRQVYLDKYEITAGRVRAWIEWLTATYGGQPNMRAYVMANTPPIWNASWNMFLATGFATDSQSLPNNPNPYPPYGPTIAPPWIAPVGVNGQFGSVLFTYIHGHNTFHSTGAYGLTTFWYPADVMMTPNGGLARANGVDSNGNALVAKNELDKKAMSAITHVALQAFCHWDGGQLATDEVLDYVTDSAPTLGNAAGCGRAPTNRCAPFGAVNPAGTFAPNINATSDSGGSAPLNYNYPYYANGAGGNETHEGVNRIAPPGRMIGDKVRVNAADEPWMDVHGNLHEQVLDMTGATFTGNFGLKYRGIGYSSARALQNGSGENRLRFAEYKAAYSGGRCMRFK